MALHDVIKKMNSERTYESILTKTDILFVLPMRIITADVVASQVPMNKSTPFINHKMFATAEFQRFVERDLTFITRSEF